MAEKYRVKAVAIGHLDFGVIEAKDEGMISQMIMRDSRLRVLGKDIEKASLVITEVITEAV
jgi:hypothetical protein